MFIFSVLELLTVFLTSILLFYYCYYNYCFTYWKKKGLPIANPRFPVGDLGSSAWGRQSVFVRLQNLYNEFKAKGCKHAGIYFLNGPLYFPIHPDLVKKVLVTDFSYFVDRGMYENEIDLPLSSHIFSMKSEKWKNIRMKVSPTFTPGKMKSMFNILVKNCEGLVGLLEPLAEEKSVINIKDILLRFSADIIGSTSFGIDADSLRYPQSEFSKMVDKISNHSGWKLLRLALEEGLQNPGNIEKIAYDDKTIESYFTNLVKQTIDYRDKNNIVRHDFLNTLMQLRTSGMSLKEIVAQAYLFFIAGFKTSALTMCYCLHELMYNVDIQERLRKDILSTLGNDFTKYSYDDVMNLRYLDMVVKEALRKYPPLPMLNRFCVKSYKVPESDAVIEEGTPVIISVLGLQRDPEYYPEPLKFDPECFNGQNEIVPYTYLPFGDGPRNCIGLRFGIMKTKLAIAVLVNNFKFLPSSKTPRNLTIDPATTSIVLNVLNGFYTKIEKI